MNVTAIVRVVPRQNVLILFCSLILSTHVFGECKIRLVFFFLKMYYIGKNIIFWKLYYHCWVVYLQMSVLVKVNMGIFTIIMWVYKNLLQNISEILTSGIVERIIFIEYNLMQYFQSGSLGYFLQPIVIILQFSKYISCVLYEFLKSIFLSVY